MKRTERREQTRKKTIQTAALKTFTVSGAARWLATPNSVLNNKRPIECIGSDEAMNNVLDILGRIQHGIIA